MKELPFIRTGGFYYWKFISLLNGCLQIYSNLCSGVCLFYINLVFNSWNSWKVVSMWVFSVHFYYNNYNKTGLNEISSRASLCVQNRQVFGLYRLNQQRFSEWGLYVKFGLYKVPVYSGFGLERFHCRCNIKYLIK